MSSVTVVPTVEATNVPPRVKLDVTDTGTSPSIFSTTVTRLDPDGEQRVVRTSDGNPLTLVTSGSNRVGTLYDYEAPYGIPVTYSTQESPTNVSASVTVAVADVWLIHPSVPSISLPIELRANSHAEETWDVQQGVFWPMGRRFPVVQTDGARKAPASSVTVAIGSLTELAALKALVADASVLLLNPPAGLGMGLERSYIAIGQIHNRRVTDIGTDPLRAVELPYQVVDAPVGGTQAARTYAALLTFASYSELNAAYPTYADLLAGP